MQVKAVIGAAFGDEGKGSCTAFLSNPSTLVVRYNGGAQAGHTVIHNGARHVFHHFGSGSFKGAATYLSRHFLVNPLLWQNELTELLELGIDPVLYINSSALGRGQR